MPASDLSYKRTLHHALSHCRTSSWFRVGRRRTSHKMRRFCRNLIDQESFESGPSLGRMNPPIHHLSFSFGRPHHSSERHRHSRLSRRRLDHDGRHLVSGSAKSVLEPPEFDLRTAWTVILALAAWSGVLAWTNAVDDYPGRVLILALFAINAVLHMLWSPLFFALKRPDWSLFEVPFLWLSIAALMFGVGRYSTLAVWLLLPYLLWVTFAAFLNFKIVRLNRRFGERA
jgi:translocator protein